VGVVILRIETVRIVLETFAAEGVGRRDLQATEGRRLVHDRVAHAAVEVVAGRTMDAHDVVVVTDGERERVEPTAGLLVSRVVVTDGQRTEGTGETHPGVAVHPVTAFAALVKLQRADELP